MKYLYGVILALLGAVFFFMKKSDTAESLLTNNEVKGKLNTLDQQISKNKGSLESEEQKRQEELERLNKELNTTPDVKDIEDFFNNPR